MLEENVSQSFHPLVISTSTSPISSPSTASNLNSIVPPKPSLEAKTLT